MDSQLGQEKNMTKGNIPQAKTENYKFKTSMGDIVRLRCQTENMKGIEKDWGQGECPIT